MPYPKSITALRKKAGMSVKEFAAEMRVNVVTVWRWDANKVPIPGLALKALDQIAQRAGFTAFRPPNHRETKNAATRKGRQGRQDAQAG